MLHFTATEFVTLEDDSSISPTAGLCLISRIISRDAGGMQKACRRPQRKSFPWLSQELVLYGVARLD
jgi:hypothetical protein